jgi:hypothetical protein
MTPPASPHFLHIASSDSGPTDALTRLTYSNVSLEPAAVKDPLNERDASVTSHL